MAATSTHTPQAVQTQSEHESNRVIFEPASCWAANAGRIVLGGFILVLVAILVADSLSTQLFIQWVSGFMESVASSGWVGALIFAATYCVCAALMIPASALTLGAGFVFVASYGWEIGFPVALLCSWIPATIAAIADYAAAALCFRACVQSASEQYLVLRTLESAATDPTKAWRIIVLCRLSPVVPFGLFNLWCGAQGVPLLVYGTWSLIGMLPGGAAYVYLGAIAGDLTIALSGGAGDGSSTEAIVQWVLLGLGLAATFAAAGLLAWYARQELGRHTADTSDEPELDADLERNSAGACSTHSSEHDIGSLRPASEASLPAATGGVGSRASFESTDDAAGIASGQMHRAKANTLTGARRTSTSRRKGDVSPPVTHYAVQDESIDPAIRISSDDKQVGSTSISTARHGASAARRYQAQAEVV